MEAHPKKSNEAIFKALIQSCDKYSSPDSAYGHGIPDLVLADSLLNSFVEIKVINPLEVSLFPNPASNQMQLITEPGSQYSIYNSIGQKVQTGYLYNWMNFISVAPLPSGNYLLEVYNNKGLARKKFIVAR